MLLGATAGAAALAQGFVDPELTERLAEAEKAKAEKGPKVVIKKSPRSYIVILNRQEYLRQVGFQAPDPVNQEVSMSGEEADIGYGRCAETMFYVWAGRYV